MARRNKKLRIVNPTQLANAVKTLAVRPSGTMSRSKRRRQQAKRASARCAISPFLECYLSRVGARPMGMGIPDKNGSNTIVVDHRYAVSIQPNAAGQVYFAIVPSCMGGVAIQRGVFTATTWSKPSNTFKSHTFSTDVADWSSEDPNGLYHLLPFTEYQNGDPTTSSSSGGSQNSAAYYTESWRVISSKAKILYTGDDFHNSGSVTVARQNIKATDTTFTQAAAGQAYTTGWYQISEDGPQILSDFLNIADSVTMPIRDGAGVNNTVESWDFIPYREGFVPTSVTPQEMAANFATNPSIAASFSQLGYDVTNTKISTYPMPGFANMSTTFVAIEGLQSGQSIFVDCANCVEYQLNAKSSMAKMAKPSPPEDAAALKQVADASRRMPTAITAAQEKEGWLPWLERMGGYIATGGEIAASALPYGASAFRGARMVYDAIGKMGGGRAIANYSRYAIGM